MDQMQAMPEACGLRDASYYVEDLKFGEGPQRMERVGNDQIVAQLETMFGEIGLKLDAADVIAGCDWLGASNASAFGVPTIIGRSIFLDGLMHGIALAGGLKADPPVISEEG